MQKGPESPVIEHLRNLRAELMLIRHEMKDVAERLKLLEMAVSRQHGDFAQQSARASGIEKQLEKLQRRLEPANA